MRQIRGLEFHNIIENVFQDVKGLNISEQLQVDCPRCAETDGLSHGDGKHNLEINTAKRAFRCWRCEPQFSGSLGKLIRTFGTSIDYDLYKSYASIYSEYEDYEDDEKEYVAVKLPEEMILFSEMDALNTEHFEAYNYLINERVISRDIILKYRLGFCTKGKYEKRIIIPSYDKNGDVNYFVGRSYNPKEKRKYLNPDVDKNRFIFNEGLINYDSLVFIVEGVFDMLSLPNAIPLLGKTISTTLYLKLKELKPKIIIVLDPDAWINEMKIYDTLKLIYGNEDKNILVLNLKGTHDIDETRKFLGENGVIKLLYGARELNNNDCFDKKLINEKIKFKKFHNKIKFNT